MKKIIYVSFIFIISSLFSMYAWGISYGFMKDSPLRYFTQDDWKLFYAASRKALNTNTTQSWKNPKSGSSGSMTPLEKVTRKGQLCRNMKVTNKAKEAMPDQYVMVFCKYKEGWKLAKD
jgi:hypothetical protein